jgi:hypothetical protein
MATAGCSLFGALPPSLSTVSTVPFQSDRRSQGWALRLLKGRVGCKMSDPYLEAIREQWPNILKLYEAFKRQNPVMLYDFQENKVYAYPYKEFRAELSIRSQASLKDQYESASAQGSMVIFVRDNLKRKQVSFTMDIQDYEIMQVFTDARVGVA